ncbi:MAG: hypothetical protein PVH02_15590 [Desulfobacteraceae bacterium]|jgi:hypothetical protein
MAGRRRKAKWLKPPAVGALDYVPHLDATYQALGSFSRLKSGAECFSIAVLSTAMEKSFISATSAPRAERAVNLIC